MDFEAVEKRISELEEVLGLDDVANTKPIPGQIEALEAKLRDDCKANLLMTIPIEKLRQLNRIATEMNGPLGSLSEKIESITFAENLINQRADRLKTFSEALEPCLDAELFGKIAALQPELDAEIEKYQNILEEWRKIYGEISTLVSERSMITRKITQKMQVLEQTIELKSK